MSSGPFVNVAAFCDMTLLGADGTLSVIRIVDTVTNEAAVPEPPESMPPFVFATKLVLALKAGEARGRFSIKMRPEAPDGRTLAEQESTIHLDGGNSGVNLVTDVQIGLDMEGLYWFDIVFVRAPGEEQLLTRVPLLVRYQPRKT
jgi:hypothetical protein